jgi:hypothetical protein
MSNPRNGNIGRTPCQFAFLRNPPESGRNQWGITKTSETVTVIVTLLLVYFILALTWKSWVLVLRGELASIHLKAKALLGNHPYNFEQSQPPSYNFEQRQPLDVEMLLQLDDRLLRRILK